MPTYEYACRTCGEHLEVVQSFKDDALTECPACQGQLRKVFSAAGIIFKGSGWHVKDYASAGKRGASSSSGSSGSSSEGSSSEGSAPESSSKETGGSGSTSEASSSTSSESAASA